MHLTCNSDRNAALGCDGTYTNNDGGEVTGGIPSDGGDPLSAPKDTPARETEES